MEKPAALRSNPKAQKSNVFFLDFATVYRYLNTEITPLISRDGFRNVLLAVRAEACGRFCGSMMLAEALAEVIAEGSVEARCLEVPTKRKLVFAEALRKLAGGRAVISKEIKKE